MEDMCTLGESIYYDAFDEGTVQTMLECIRKLMKTTGWSAQKAMRQLDVPEEEQAMYEELLKEQ